MKIDKMKNVRFQSGIVLLAFLVSMSFPTDTIRSSIGDKDSGPNIKDLDHDKHTLGGIGKNLMTHLAAYKNLGDVIFQGLKTIVEDENYKDKVPLGDEARIYAALQMGKIRSKDVIKYQLEHITLYIPKQIIGEDVGAKSFPHKYGLKLRGWEVIPYIFEHIRKTRNEKEMLMITELFVDICGRQMSKAILEVKKQENPPSAPENEILCSNIDFIVKHLKK